MKQGEIWFVHFMDSESMGHEYKKDRPVLIVRSDNQSEASNMVSIIPLTSVLESKRKDDILIEKDGKNNLFYGSLLKVHHLKSFDKTRFIKKIGIVSDEILEETKKYLKNHFGV